MLVPNVFFLYNTTDKLDLSKYQVESMLSPLKVLLRFFRDILPLLTVGIISLLI